MAVGQAHADIEHPIGARKYPAIALAQLLVPHHLQRADLADRIGVVHIAAQRDAAGRVALAHAGGHQGLGHGASGQHHPAGVDLMQATGGRFETGANHNGGFAISAQQRRLEAPGRKKTGAGTLSGTLENVIQLLAWQHRQPPRHIDAAAARADAAHMLGPLRDRHHLGQHTEFVECVVGIRDQAVATHLVARKGVLIDQHHIQPGPRQRLCAGAAGRACADDQHVAVGGGEGGRGHRGGRHGCGAVDCNERQLIVGMGRLSAACLAL